MRSTPRSTDGRSRCRAKSPTRRPPDRFGYPWQDGLQRGVTEYKQELASKSHKALLGAVLDRFDADVDGKHEPWVRYMVIHYSGLQYESAHDNFADPKLLFQHLVRREMAGLVADPARVTPKRLLELAREARSVIAANPSAYKTSQQELDPNPGKLADLSEAQVADPKNKKDVETLRTRVANFFYWQASSLVADLDGAEHLGMIQARAPTTQTPARAVTATAWKYIVSLTTLRNDASSIAELVYKRNIDTKTESPNPTLSEKEWSEAAVVSWKKDTTQWRQYHAKTLEPMMRAVCNEIDEMSLHARGRRRQGESRRTQNGPLGTRRAGSFDRRHRSPTSSRTQASSSRPGTQSSQTRRT
jgi:hypothetical protein